MRQLQPAQQRDHGQRQIQPGPLHRHRADTAASVGAVRDGYSLEEGPQGRTEHRQQHGRALHGQGQYGGGPPGRAQRTVHQQLRQERCGDRRGDAGQRPLGSGRRQQPTGPGAACLLQRQLSASVLRELTCRQDQCGEGEYGEQGGRLVERGAGDRDGCGQCVDGLGQ
ncbi:hypothetical protein [Streptacidiphilus sp. EB103A]|uniref:hypothetical protein n=1 Tax=Streptacidiphilus sp. EB103A TaxID=3156275 RepID=UPI003516A6B9